MQKLDPKTVSILPCINPPTTLKRVIRELVENSIDAGATEIKVMIFSNGFDKICVSDNGCGIKRENAQKICSFNVTSKIKNYKEIQNAETFGFSGSSLASISCICESVEIQSFSVFEEKGFSAFYSFSSLATKPKDFDSRRGTTVVVHKLFYNLPENQITNQRNAETTASIQRMLLEYSILYPALTIYVTDNQRNVYKFDSLSNSNAILQSICPQSGPANNILIPGSIDFEDGKRITMICGNPNHPFNRNKLIKISINGRHVSIPLLKSSIIDFFEGIARDYKAICLIIIKIPAEQVDMKYLSKDKIKLDADDPIIIEVVRKLNDIYTRLTQFQESPCYTQAEFDSLFERICLTQRKHPNYSMLLYPTVTSMPTVKITQMIPTAMAPASMMQQPMMFPMQQMTMPKQGRQTAPKHVAVKR